MKSYIFIVPATLVLALMMAVMACSFSQFAQSEDLTENLGEYRTGCTVDEDKLLQEYLQHDANRFYFAGSGTTPNPTNTPSPAEDTDIATQRFLKEIWEHGCSTGRTIATDAETNDLMDLQDQIDVLATKVADRLTPTATVVATSTPTP